MALVQTSEPAEITAGDTVSWLRTLADYPASAGWVLSYVLINAAGKITLTGAASADDHLISASAATSAAYAAGNYDWQASVSLGSEKYTVATGRIKINPSFAAAATLDRRSPMRRALEDYENAYVAYIGNESGHIAEYEIAGRKMKFRTAAEIWMQIEKLRREVAREDQAARLAAGLPARRRVLVRFGA